MTKKERYEYRKSIGICVECGREKASDKAIICESCREKRNRSRREDRKFYQSLGYCPICRQNRIVGDEKTCPECRIKRNKYAAKTLEKESTKQRINKYGRRRYAELKEKHICPHCGKRKAAPGRVSCGICLNKANNRAKAKRNAIPRHSREYTNLCIQCGKLPRMNDGKLCQECYKKSIENLAKARQSPRYAEGWRKTNSHLYRKPALIMPM